MIPVTMSAGYLNITTNYLPKGDWLKAGLSITLMCLMAVVFAEAFWKWFQLSRIKDVVQNAHGDAVLVDVPE